MRVEVGVEWGLESGNWNWNSKDKTEDLKREAMVNPKPCVWMKFKSKRGMKRSKSWSKTQASKAWSWLGMAKPWDERVKLFYRKNGLD